MSEENQNVEGAAVNSAEKQTFSLDDIKRLSLEDEAVKNWLQSEKDRHFSKGLDTWKEKSLPELLESEIKKRYPDETEEQKQLRELKLQFDQLKQEKQKETIRNQAYKEATEKGLPLQLLDFFVAGDLEATQSNLTTLEKVWNEALKAAVGETFKANGREPYKGTQATNNIVNPWKRETFNLTKQAQILKENPGLAKSLQSQAK
jgi:hypothetical protein